MIERACQALQLAWDSYDPELPPIIFTPEEAEHLVRAVLAAVSPHPEPAREEGNA